eukprot:CAMPEP_0196598392 /NCGR_PEP_ID=MMETSP1081-20130531/94295_1 /TAXON_ID=36882 /ORGANISM="Pyramimonas amylifera, Strain CCMP720" /LENGTH=1715 /DNA_ID=CAMNT_0041924083 /DNA_START=22 /DNA_END=5170 /DNA_ORIENTATION=-
MSYAHLLVFGLFAWSAQVIANDVYDPVPLPLSWSASQSCTPYSWKDYYIQITAANAGDNLIFEVDDTGDINFGYKLNALSVHLFRSSIPSDRVTPYYALTATHGLYEISVSSHDVQEDMYYLSVLCGPTGANFRVRIREFSGEFLGAGNSIDGQLCPGNWAYHKFSLDTQQVASTPHVRVTFSGFHEHVYVLVHDGEAPLHLVNPFFLISPDDQLSTLTSCNVVADHHYFVGVKGYLECLDYTATITYLSDADFDSGKCEEEEAVEISAYVGLHALEVDQFSKFTASAWSEYDFYLYVDAANSNDNLVIEVEDLAPELRSQGLKVSLFSGTMPADRVSEFTADFTHDKMYSLAVNLYDLVEGDYYVSVQVRDVDTEFRVLARLIQGQMHLGDHVNGVVCPGELIYHFYDHFQSSSETTETKRRMLSEDTSSEVSILSHAPNNIRFKLKLHSGDVYYTITHVNPALKLVPPYRHLDYLSQGNVSHTSVDICELEHGLQYISMQGGDECSEYELSLEEIEIGECEELEHQCLAACEVLCDILKFETFHYDTARPLEAIAADECFELEHECLEDCSVLCDILQFDHFHYDHCSPNEWKDYMFEVKEEHLENNLIVEVDTAFGDNVVMDFEAVGLYMFRDTLPSDRKTDKFNVFSAEMSWSIAVNSHELTVGNYFFSVKCGMSPVKFRMLAQLTTAHMTEGERVAGVVCPGEIMYHYAQVGDTTTTASSGHKMLLSESSTTYGHAKFTIQVHSGNLFYLSRHEHPPLKLIPPYQSTSYIQQMSTNTLSEIGICDMTAGKHYLALKGGTECSHYEVTLALMGETEACEELQHDAQAAGNAYDSMTHLYPGHSIVGSCEANSFTDYYLNISSMDAESNFVLEVHDALNDIDTSAITVSLYYGAIPSNRKTQFYDDFSNDHVFAVAMNVWDLLVGEYFVSIKCGPRPVSYTIIPELFSAHLSDGGHVAGEVCPGNFVMHFVDVPEVNGAAHHLGHVQYTLKMHSGTVRYKVQHHDPAAHLSDGGHVAGEVCPGNFVMHFMDVPEVDGAAHHLGHVQYTLKLHSGTVRYKVQHHDPALKMGPPFGTASASEHLAHGGNTTIQACDVDQGSWYITLSALESCAEYDMYVNLQSLEDECSGVEQDLEAETVSTTSTLKAGHYKYASCESNEYVDFQMTVNDTVARNLIIEVEDMESSLDTEALAIYLFHDAIPENRKTEYRSEYSNSQVWSLSVSSHDMVNGEHFLSIRCGPNPRAFRILYILIDAELVADEWIHGEICPGDWVHHYLDVLDMQLNGELSGPSTSVEFDVDLHEGSMYYLLRVEDAPTRLSPPYRYADSSATSSQETLFHTSFCYTRNYPSVHKYYLSLKGGANCATYSVRARVVEECESPFSHDMTLEDTQSTEVFTMTVGKFSYATCQPFSYIDYTFEIPVEQEGNNMVLEVEDLGDNDNPNSLTVDLYKLRSSIPTNRNWDDQVTSSRNSIQPYSRPVQAEEQHPHESYWDDQVTSSRNSIYSIALNTVNLAAGTYFASVRCAHEPVQYRAVVNYVHAQMESQQFIHGQVSPAEWIFHYYERASLTDTSKNHVRFVIEIFNGHVYMVLARVGFPPGFAIRSKNVYMMKVDDVVVNENGKLYIIVDVCDAPIDQKVYIGLHGGDYVSEYAVYVQGYKEGDVSAISGSIMPSSNVSSCVEYTNGLSGYVVSASTTTFIGMFTLLSWAALLSHLI